MRHKYNQSYRDDYIFKKIIRRLGFPSGAQLHITGKYTI